MNKQLRLEHKNTEIALNFFTLGFNFLILVENALSEAIKDNNLWMYFGDNALSEDIYHEKTKWSDFNILVPALFNFYHALELIMKGIISIEGRIEPSHKLSILLGLVEPIERLDFRVKEILKSHILMDEISEVLNKYLQKNQQGIDGLYENLRYPVDKCYGKVYSHSELKYKEEKIIPYYNEIVDNSLEIRKLIVKYYRDAVDNLNL